ncbi:MAG: membrane protein insertase YidC, partial [Sphaerochaetaceae bacterium]|nr:membrane protein insertase YidC [Sphaerochaetaceae bacterium]
MKNKYRQIALFALMLVCVFCLSGCAKEDYYTSALGSGNFGFWDIFVYPMAAIMWLVGKTIGFGNYALTIIFSTLIVRTIAWPIYAKSNDMQLKMKIAEPELGKLKRKYENRTDQESQRMMQMEQMQIYKKYGIGFGGCIMPLVQMPIFLGFYYALRKLPPCMEVEGHWLNIFTSTKLFGVDMTLVRNAEGTGKAQLVGVIILAVLVGITQVVSIILSDLRQKKANNIAD